MRRFLRAFASGPGHIFYIYIPKKKVSESQTVLAAPSTFKLHFIDSTLRKQHIVYMRASCRCTGRLRREFCGALRVKRRKRNSGGAEAQRTTSSNAHLTAGYKPAGGSTASSAPAEPSCCAGWTRFQGQRSKFSTCLGLIGRASQPASSRRCHYQ